MHRLAKLDHRYVWHPFTQMRDWLKREPIVIVEGDGAVVRDAKGNEYLDANSSIWTNLHGHNHPRINGAIARQLKRIAHSSALGLGNEPASLLAEELVKAANPGDRDSRFTTDAGGLRRARHSSTLHRRLAKVFFSDDGSTALEAGLKLAYEFTRRTGRSRKPRFLSLAGAYHGDTVGAVSLGHIDLFHKAYSRLLFKTDQVMAPYCYRCPYNRASPERADAREYRKCGWECLGQVEQKFKRQKKRGSSYAAFVFEPLIQGAAGMVPQPAGWLRRAAQIGREYGALLIADEVMTGFGRTGIGTGIRDRQDVCPTRFACQREGVQADLLVLAKGLTGGYLPMGATLTTQAIFDAFLGEYHEFKTFFHGHSYTANQLGAAAALASLEILSSPHSIRSREHLERALGKELLRLWANPHIGDIRRVGLIAGIELVKDWRTRESFEPRDRAGVRVCEAMARRGVLTRPIGNVIVLMPPFCTTAGQVERMVTALHEAVGTVLGG
jgi:adenosylmethionine-8-amino-7-oxononanoate aminotransferase